MVFYQLSRFPKWIGLVITILIPLANAATVYTEGKEQLDAAAQQMAEIVHYFENTNLEDDED